MLLFLFSVALFGQTYAELPGVRLFYRDSGGAGVPIVLLHAASGSTEAWKYQTRALQSAGYRVISYDRRGWGRTVIDASGPQPGTAAEDLLQLANHLKLDRFHLLGTAAGGYVVLDFAISYPDRLKSIIVANSMAGLLDADFQKRLQMLRPEPFSSLPVEFRELGPSYRAANVEGTEDWKQLEKISRPKSAAAARQPYRNQVTRELLSKVNVPALVLTGGADLYAPPAIMRFVADSIKGAEFLVVPDAGHSTYWEQPDVFNRAVIRFLSKHK